MNPISYMRSTCIFSSHFNSLLHTLVSAAEFNQLMLVKSFPAVCTPHFLWVTRRAHALYILNIFSSLLVTSKNDIGSSGIVTVIIFSNLLFICVAKVPTVPVCPRRYVNRLNIIHCQWHPKKKSSHFYLPVRLFPSMSVFVKTPTDIFLNPIRGDYM